MAPFSAACGLFTASGNGSGRPWNTAAVVFLTARICRKRRRAFIRKGDRLAYTVTDASRER
ncbi:hypothetical protein ECZU03_57710 [Escherichia coli]|nr:hypothetical protein ECZU03_57710 [Escherichia coli]